MVELDLSNITTESVNNEVIKFKGMFTVVRNWKVLPRPEWHNTMKLKKTT